MTTRPPDSDGPDVHLEIVADVGADAPLSPRLAAALDELSAALAAEEIGGYLEALSAELDDEVVGFSFGRTFGDLGLSPNATHICISKNTTGSGSCGSWCGIYTDDGDIVKCRINIY